MNITIEGTKCKITHELELDLTGALRVETMEIWHVKANGQIAVASTQESAQEIKDRLEKVAQAHGRTIEVTIEQQPTFVRRNHTDEEIIQHIKLYALRDFQTSLGEFKIQLPPVS